MLAHSTLCITFGVGAWQHGTCATAAAAAVVTVKSISKSNQPSEIINEMKLQIVVGKVNLNMFPSRCGTIACEVETNVRAYIQ